jgi:hypothetical protein
LPLAKTLVGIDVPRQRYHGPPVATVGTVFFVTPQETATEARPARLPRTSRPLEEGPRCVVKPPGEPSRD